MLRRPAGFVFDDNGEAGQTKQCVHCGAHWNSKVRDPKDTSPKVLRGFCMNCNGPVCGASCAVCIPIEKKLEMIEGSVNPTAVSVPVLWTP